MDTLPTSGSRQSYIPTPSEISVGTLEHIDESLVDAFDDNALLEEVQNVDEGEGGEPDYTDPEFVLQNLKITHEDCFDDPTLVLSTRKRVSEDIVHQICFYLMCCLRAKMEKETPPSILIFGADGYIGKRLVEMLLEFHLGQFLFLFSRSSADITHWKEKHVQIGCNMNELLGANGKPDIIIMCSGVSSFPAICHHVINRLTPETVFIYSTLGLQRRRIFSVLNIQTVFRTYQETNNVMTGFKTKRKTEKSISIIPYNRHSTGKMIDIRESDETRAVSRREAAIRLLKRTVDVRHLIFVLENLYALHGAPHAVARHAAVRAVVGDKLLNEIAERQTSPVRRARQAQLQEDSSNVSSAMDSHYMLSADQNDDFRAMFQGGVQGLQDSFDENLGMSASSSESRHRSRSPSHQINQFVDAVEKKNRKNSVHIVPMTLLPPSRRVSISKQHGKHYTMLYLGMKMLQRFVGKIFQDVFKDHVKFVDLAPIITEELQAQPVEKDESIHNCSVSSNGERVITARVAASPTRHSYGAPERLQGKHRRP